jgi:hypothetical protein
LPTCIATVAAAQRHAVVTRLRLLLVDLIASQHRVDARQELAEGIGLGHIVVRPDLQPDHGVDLRAFGCNHDDRHAALLADAPAQFDPVDAGQHEIKQHQIYAAAREQEQALFAGRSRAHRIAFASELVDQRLPVGFLILNDKNSRHA